VMDFRSWIKFGELLRHELLHGLVNEAAFPEEWATEAISKPEFNSWLHSLGINEPLRDPKAGGVGRAYFAGDHVVKFTTDKKEADAAAVVKGYDSPNLSKVIDVKMVSVNLDQYGRNRPLYAIVQQKVSTDVTKRHRVAGQAIYDYLDRNPGLLRSNASSLLPLVASFLPKKYKDDEPTINLVQKLLEKIKKIQDDTGFLTQDTHGANIGMKGREPAFFDLGRSTLDLDHPATAGARVTRL